MYSITERYKKHGLEAILHGRSKTFSIEEKMYNYKNNYRKEAKDRDLAIGLFQYSRFMVYIFCIINDRMNVDGENMDIIKIGKFIKELRSEKEMTQDELASKIGSTYKTISRWENGNYMTLTI